MEEDIKNLEEIINLCKEELDKNDLNISAVLDFIDLKSLRNLLKKYKEQKERIKGLEQEKEVHAETICQLEKENETLKEITNQYNAFANDYIPNDMKMIIADREYFNNGIFKENFTPKFLIKEKIEELKQQYKEELKGMKGQDRYFVKQMYQYKIQVLEELLNGKM